MAGKALARVGIGRVVAVSHVLPGAIAPFLSYVLIEDENHRKRWFLFTRACRCKGKTYLLALLKNQGLQAVRA